MPFGMWQALGNAFNAKNSNKKLAELWTKNPTYQKNPLAAQRFGLAQNLFNSPMFGMQEAQRNILNSNANFNSNVQRNATDSSTALAMAAAGQGQTDDAFADLQQKQGQFKYGMLGNLNQAYGQMINEDDKVYEDQVRRFGDRANIQGAMMKNKENILTGAFNGLNSDFNDAAQIFSMFGGGGFGGGGNRNATGANPNVTYPGWNQWQQYKRK